MSQGRTYRDTHGREASSRQKIISNKSPSDTEYDVRSQSTRLDPSYHGVNFKSSEKGRSSSFALGNRKEPKMPNPYTKRPHPYPPNVAKDYDAYKQYERDFARAKARYNVTNPHNIGKRDGDRERKWKEGLPLAREARTMANQAGASRTGFDHKYPYAYDSVASKESHREQVDNNLVSARRYATYEGMIKGKLENEHRSRRSR